MLCSVYTTIAGEYDGPGFCTPIGYTNKFVPKIGDWRNNYNVFHVS